MRFAYGHEHVLAALQSNADYSAYRRQHGDKAAGESESGQAISYRFKRDAKGWRLFVTTNMMDVPVVTDGKRGTIGVELNVDHLAVAETYASGNCLNAWRVPLVTYGKNTHQAEALIGDAVASVVEYAKEVGKPIVSRSWTSGRRRSLWRASPENTAGCCRLSATARSRHTSSPAATGRELKYIRSTRPTVR